MLIRAAHKQKQQSSDSPAMGELLLCCFCDVMTRLPHT